MRIVEYGHIQPKEVKCNHCGAILEYVPNDIKQHIRYRVPVIFCPVCGKGITTDNDGNYFEFEEEVY